MPLTSVSKRASSLLILSVILLFGWVAAAGAQGAATVAPDDQIYLDLDRLIDAGLVDTLIVGQRPYSWRQVERIVEQARARIAARAPGNPAPSRAERALERLTRRVNIEERTRIRTGVGAGVLATDAPSRAVPDNGLGTIEADLNPLTSDRHGRRYLPGSNAELSADLQLDVADRFALVARPRLWGYMSRGPEGSDWDGDLLSGNVRALVRNLAITVGREHTVWMPAEGGGLFFSANAPGLDMIRLASDRPFVLPWLFRYLGPVGATIQIADLGRSASNSHSRLVSYKVSAAPVPGFEVGATFENHFGGAGARNPSAMDRFIDLVPFIDVFKRHHDSTDFDSDKLLGLDARIQLRNAGNVTLFGELALEDFDIHRPGSIFTEDAAYSLGIRVPELITPSLSAQLRFHTLGLRFYQHHAVKNGIAARRFTLGDVLGKDATGLALMLRWDGGRGVTATWDAAIEQRRNDEYEGRYVNPGGKTGLEFQRVSTVPSEKRVRNTLGLRWLALDGFLALDLRGGVERTTNFGFMAGPAESHGLGAISATIFP